MHAVEMVRNKVRKCRRGWCALITLDVRNAFNGLIANYLQDRCLQTTTDEQIKVTSGVPQGSILGPIL